MQDRIIDNNETSRRTNMLKYPAVMYYEQHPTEVGKYQIHVRFIDLIKSGLPAYTVGNDPEDAHAAAKEILGMMREYAAEMGKQLPEPSPLDALEINRGYETDSLFKIVIEHIQA
jgi:predicted RNase H-like HicB family nuclease